MGKFNTRTKEGMFLGYSSSEKEYKCYNKRLRIIVESIYVKIDEEQPQKTEVQEEKESNHTSCVEEEFNENEEEHEFKESMEANKPKTIHRNWRI